ncbi:NAD(P)/FAD-dependent oxidoreductase [Pelagicoccus albus]|uniref:FAD-dependent oxidoreductase n=1 Tax=Pelagicoccus albus TaxID=415222 RepID=A0A7X1E9Y3_9BACT|nr:NAD(P)/FAD-dependent oxidoreductase [Pelagicoccus albus]MBC2606247.1 FAD-dependent oxidoreductase [Pelagicoccus albus]
MTTDPNTRYDAIIIGAGLAGLSCAIGLLKAGKEILILEASDRVGGRLRTSDADGFLFDHGFQVLLTEYSECQRLLDYDKLQLGKFEPGAYVWTGSKLDTVADPIRQPGLILSSLASSTGSFGDKLKVAGLKSELAKLTIEDLYAQPETNTRQALKERGFSEKMIDGFFAPFFGGIFLENELATSSRIFDFVFKCFGQGYAALPDRGMAEIPKQLAAQIPDDRIRLNSKVASIEAGGVTLQLGESLQAQDIVLATDMSEAARLESSISDRGWNGTRSYYFSSNSSPLSRPMIALNGSGKGIIQNVSVPSDVSSGYAPEGKSLICVSTSGIEAENPGQVAEELIPWFGTNGAELEFLRSIWVPHSLPRQLPGDLLFESAELKTENGLWLCGDHRYSSSIQGALRSGARVAEAIGKSV